MFFRIIFCKDTVEKELNSSKTDLNGFFFYFSDLHPMETATFIYVFIMITVAGLLFIYFIL